MILSMTGYGRGSSASGDVEVTVEVRTLNHRYLEINLRLSSQYASMEPHIRDTIRKFIKRGKADVSVTIRNRRDKTRKLSINRPLLGRYLEIEKELRETFGFSGSLNLENVFAIDGVISMEEVEPGEDMVARRITAALKEAMKGVCRMRKEEGKSIGGNLKETAKNLKSLNRNIDRLSEESKKIMGQRMRERIEEYLDQNLNASGNLDDRLSMEIALLADKLDVTEEVARIGSHLEQFGQNLRSKSGSVGRKLDFILQELNREFNTIGSKSQSDKIVALVIEAKAHLEKMREQVQNVE